MGELNCKKFSSLHWVQMVPVIQILSKMYYTDFSEKKISSLLGEFFQDFG